MPKHPHPGEILIEKYLEPLSLSGRLLAHYLNVPQNRITDILRGRRSVTADTALRLARYFKTTPEYWMDMQTAHNLAKARDEGGAEIKKIKPRRTL